MPIKFENFDSVVAPALPSGWTFASGLVTTTTPGGGLSPISSPNVLELPATGTSGYRFAVYNTADSNGGDVAVQGYFAGATVSGVDPQSWGLIARASATSVTNTSGTYYWGTIEPETGGVSLSKVVSGSRTFFTTVTPVTLAGGVWYLGILTCLGTAISLAVQRQSDSKWLDNTGAWVVGQTTAIAVTDSAVTGSGFAGLTLRSRSDDSSADDWTFDNVVPAIITVPPLPIRAPSRSGRPRRPSAFPGLPWAPRPRLTQEPVRSLVLPGDADLRLTQLAFRVLIQSPSGILIARPPRHDAMRDAAPRRRPAPILPPLLSPNRTAPVPPAASRRHDERPPGLTPHPRIAPPIRTPPPPVTPTPMIPGTARARLRSYEDRAKAGLDWLGRNADTTGTQTLTNNLPDKGPFQLGGLCSCCTPDCQCIVKVCVQGCGGANIPGATVTISQSGSKVASCVTDAKTGCCPSLCLPGGAGTYDVTVTAGGYNTSTGSYALTCGGSTTITLTPTGSNAPCFAFQVGGCCCAGLPGATVTVTAAGGGASGGGTKTTDSAGRATICVGGPGTYNWTVSAPRFATQNGSFTVANCSEVGNTISVCLSAQAGYVCGFDGPYPIPTTLHLTDSVWGPATLTYDALTDTFKGTTAAGPYPSTPCVEQHAGAIVYHFGCPASSGFTITWTMGHTPNCIAPTLSAAFPAAFCGDCNAGFFQWGGQCVPSDVAGTVPCSPATGTCGLGCPSNNPANRFTINFANFGGPSAGVPSEPFDATWSFTGLTYDGSECGGDHASPFPLVFPCGDCAGALWTNFGPGSITISE